MADQSPQTQMLYAIGPACLTIDALTQTLDRPRHKVTKALTRLVERGLVERREEGCFTSSESGLAMIAEGAAISTGAPTTAMARRKPIRGTLRQRAWKAMCIQPRNFTVRTIAMLAARDERDAERDLRKWFSALEAAGYLQRLPHREAGTAPSSNGLLRFTLMKNTGEIAPVLSIQHGFIRDANTGEDIPCRK